MMQAIEWSERTSSELRNPKAGFAEIPRYRPQPGESGEDPGANNNTNTCTHTGEKLLHRPAKVGCGSYSPPDASLGRQALVFTNKDPAGVGLTAEQACISTAEIPLPAAPGGASSAGAARCGANACFRKSFFSHLHQYEELRGAIIPLIWGDVYWRL